MSELTFRIIGTSVKSVVCPFSLDQPAEYTHRSWNEMTVLLPKAGQESDLRIRLS